MMFRAARVADLPAIVATGYADNVSALTVPVIRKPYDVTQIAAALAEVTGRA